MKILQHEFAAQANEKGTYDVLIKQSNGNALLASDVTEELVSLLHNGMPHERWDAKRAIYKRAKKQEALIKYGD